MQGEGRSVVVEGKHEEAGQRLKARRCAQASKAVHIQQSCYYSSDVLKLIDRLQPLMPKGIESFFFANSGAEAAPSFGATASPM